MARWSDVSVLPRQSDLSVFVLFLGQMEANMNVRAICGALIMGGLVAVAVPSSQSLAQPNNTGESVSKDAGESAPKSAIPNANVAPKKHRYWRHRGGKHPHFGSRRVRT